MLNETSLIQLVHAIHQADERTSYHLMYFITLENIKSKDRKNWDIFDHLCNEIANDESDVSETVEIQLLISLFKMKVTGGYVRFFEIFNLICKDKK